MNTNEHEYVDRKRIYNEVNGVKEVLALRLVLRRRRRKDDRTWKQPGFSGIPKYCLLTSQGEQSKLTSLNFFLRNYNRAFVLKHQ